MKTDMDKLKKASESDIYQEIEQIDFELNNESQLVSWDRASKLIMHKNNLLAELIRRQQ